VNKGQAVFRTYTTLGWCLAALPEPVAMGVASAVGDVLFNVRTDHRRMVSNNLRRVLGADASDRAVLDRWARRSFRAYARYWVEGARLGRTSPIEVEQRTFVQGLGYLVEGMAAGKGVIMALPHVGSWEYGGAFLATQGLPMSSSNSSWSSGPPWV
jgi:KDO2-lipid IV(A) lauroyltransferase